MLISWPPYLSQVVFGKAEVKCVENGGGNFDKLALVCGLFVEQVDVVPVRTKRSEKPQTVQSKRNLDGYGTYKVQ